MLAPVLYGDPVRVLLSERMRERTFAYVTEIRDTQMAAVAAHPAEQKSECGGNA